MNKPRLTPRKREQVIIVGVDGSPESIGALLKASQLAIQLGCTVHAINAFTETSFGESHLEGSRALSPRAHCAVALQQAFVAAFPHGLPNHITGSTEQGHPAHVLAQSSEDATMLVVGGRGQSGAKLGAVSAECAREARCPVLIVHTA